MVNASNRKDFQEPNRIVDIQSIFRLTQALENLEKYIDSFGRNLSDNERRLQQTLPGMIKTFKRVEKEFKDDNQKDLTKSQAADLKVFLSGNKSIFEWLNQLSKFNKAGLSLNERNDKSFIKYASMFDEMLGILSQSLQRAYKEMGGYTKNIDKVRKGYGLLPPSALAQNTIANPIPANVPYTPQRMPNPLDGHLPESWDTNLFKKYGVIPSGDYPPKVETPVSTGKLEGGESESILEHEIAKLGSMYKASSSIFEHYFDMMMGDFFKPLHAAFKSTPILGSITGASANIAEGYTKGKKAGEVLKEVAPRVFPKSGMKIAGLGKFLGPAGAIATGIGLIYSQMKKASPVLQAVSNLFELAWNLLWMPLGNALGQFLIPMAEDLINFAIMFNELFTDFSLEKLGEVFYAALQFIWGALYDISNALPTMIIDGMLDMLSNFFRSIGMDGVANAIDDFKRILSEVREFIRNLPTKIWETIKGFFQGIINFFNDPIGNIKKALSGMGQIIIDAFKSVANIGGGVIDGIKGVLGLATGGIVTAPTFAMVGEAGPEAVIPLDRANGIGTTYVININGDVYGVQDLESRIERAIQRTANKAYYR